MSDLLLSQAVEGFLLHKRAEGRSKHTLSDYRNSLRKLSVFFAPDDPPVGRISVRHLRALFNQLSTQLVTPDGAAPRPPRKLAPKTRKNIHTCYRTFWRWMMAEGYIKKSPMENIQAPRAPQKPIEPFTANEIKLMLAACERTTGTNGNSRKRHTAERDRAIILFLYDTGVRSSELTGLKIGNVDLKQGRALVTGKMGKSRYVRIGKRTRQAVWRYLTTRESTSPDDYLFTVTRHEIERPMDRNILGRLVKRIGKRAGIKKVHPHRFRHTFAVEFLRNSGNIYTLQELLGHKSLEMVRNYLRIAEADTAADHRRASPADHL